MGCESLMCRADCKVDLAFLMDGSWSIGKRRFKIQKDFLSDVAQAINVGVAGPMMGIIQYGCVWVDAGACRRCLEMQQNV